MKTFKLHKETQKYIFNKEAWNYTSKIKIMTKQEYNKENSVKNMHARNYAIEKLNNSIAIWLMD